MKCYDIHPYATITKKPLMLLSIILLLSNRIPPPYLSSCRDTTVILRHWIPSSPIHLFPLLGDSFLFDPFPPLPPSSPWSSRRLGLGFRSTSPNPSEERLCPPSPAMEGSAGDPGAPDSWEMADLDASMSRLLLSSKKGSALSPSQEAEEEEEAAAALDTTRASLASVDGAEGVPLDAVDQVDQFLREALEKPRERLASNFPYLAGLWLSLLNMLV